MRFKGWLALGVVAVMLASCGGGSSGTGGTFFLIEFLEAGQSDIPRNRILTFVFSQALLPTQDFSQRLKIQNVVQGQNSNFSLAIGRYVIDADRATFVPKLPELPDRSDAGFRSLGSYVVFVQAGPDALQSTGGDQISTPQELTFGTSEFFEDPFPLDPPRALGFIATDTTVQQEFDLSRIDPRPSELAGTPNDELITAGVVIEPGAGGAPNFSTPWQFDLIMSEPIDPATVTTKNITMLEIFDDATKSGPAAPPVSADDGFGTPVNFKVPVNVSLVQDLRDGVYDVRIRVIPLFTMVDNARYQINFSGSILGIDSRKQFVGDNGLTGDGETEIDPGQLLIEPGGLGYQAEFIVRDRPAITTTRVLEFDPLVDGIQPEQGQTETDPARVKTKFNTALYNPNIAPSQAVGFLSDFGDGSDGPLSASGGGTVTVDTGDTRNEDIGNPFTVTDLDSKDEYNIDSRPGGPRGPFDSPAYFEMQLSSIVVSSSSTLKIIGVNPVLFRVNGIVQVNGTVDASGEDGEIGGNSTASGGLPGNAGFAGGESREGVACTSSAIGACATWDHLRSQCPPLDQGYPFSTHGHGPGRGLTGGEMYADNCNDQLTNSTGGTGGGGGSHATQGEVGEDRQNAGGTPGTPGPACTKGSGFWEAKNSGVIGVRGMPGPTYGDREVFDITLGGSGGGPGGTTHTYFGQNGAMAGGAGGGGGGSVAVYAAAVIKGASGRFDVSGGDGGDGMIGNWSSNNNKYSSGGGGGGSGGNLVLVSGEAIELAAVVLDASGGLGGKRSNAGTNIACTSCNRGGFGGKGFIFLMDADGVIDGVFPSTPGEYDNYATGVLTIREFDLGRFTAINAITELYNVGAADPRYLELAPSDIVANLAPDQRIRVFVSSAKSDVDEPLVPDQATEEPDPSVEVALVTFGAGAVVVDISGSLTALNPVDDPARRAFMRTRCAFEYDIGPQAVLGPFSSIDRATFTVSFNG